MQRVSIRTLVLMLELLMAVVGLQMAVATGSAKADAIWLAGDCIVPAAAPSGEMNGTIGP
jgi:hypothetical protein